MLSAHVARIEALDARLNCFTDLTLARAQREAAAVDAKIAAGEDPGALAGVPIAVENLYDIQGLTTRAGSKIRRHAPPAAADAAVLAKLREAGAVLLGALNMDEFAFGFVTENVHDGDTHNPHDTARSAGGSSGGSAAAVAVGFAPITLGSDTNGSIRIPASFCGVFGLKPTYNRLDRTGSFPFVDSFDHLGPFARSVADLAAAYDVMQDSDKASPMLPLEVPASRVAVLGDWFERGVSDDMLAAVAIAAKGLGATARAKLPEAARARAAAFCISAFEGGQLHKAELRRRPENYDPGGAAAADCRRLAAGGSDLPGAAFSRLVPRGSAKTLRALRPAAGAGESLHGAAFGPEDDEHRRRGDSGAADLGLYSEPSISFIGLPVVCVPVVSQGLPRGVQIIAAAGREGLALAAAAKLERDGVAAAPVVKLPGAGK